MEENNPAMKFIGKLSSILKPQSDRSIIFSISNNEKFKKELDEISFKTIEFHQFIHSFEGSDEEYKKLFSYTFHTHVRILLDVNFKFSKSLNNLILFLMI